jgi:hypothetical protein
MTEKLTRKVKTQDYLFNFNKIKTSKKHPVPTHRFETNKTPNFNIQKAHKPKKQPHKNTRELQNF